MEAGLCERVGCGESQVCALLIAPQETQAWLVSPDHPSASEGVSLCDNHADRISVPFGWTLVDDRVKPKRKRRKKKVVSAAEADVVVDPPDDDPVPTLPLEAGGDGDAGSTGSESADGYVEPEYQFREDGVAGTGEGSEPSDAADTNPDVALPSPPASSDDETTASAADDMADAPDTRLSVVPPGEAGDSDDAQGALWDNAEAADNEPDESTPLLQRAFRVVRDD